MYRCNAVIRVSLRSALADVSVCWFRWPHLYLGAYVYCLVTDRDALRSETYTIQKMAIEKGFVGDSLTGVLSLDTDVRGRMIESTSDVASEDDK